MGRWKNFVMGHSYGDSRHDSVAVFRLLKTVVHPQYGRYNDCTLCFNNNTALDLAIVTWFSLVTMT